MKRRLDFDLLRVGCMCCVVYLHVAASSFQDLSSRRVWAMSNLINVAASLAVPLFFMLSGALALSRHSQADPLAALKRRLGRVLVPLAAWSGLMLLHIGREQGWAVAREGLLRILNTPANVAYWFLYALIPMYLLTPLLQVMVDGLDRRRWRYLLALWLGLTLGLSTLRGFLPPAWQGVFTEHTSLHLNAVGGYLGYYLLGAYLERQEKLPSRRLLLWGTAAASVATAVIAWVDSYALGAWSERFTGYLTLFTALRAAGVFLLAKSLWGQRQTPRWLAVLSGCSFCVYLAHPLVILSVADDVWHALTGLWVLVTIPHYLVFYLGVLVACVLLALALASVPGLCYVFTGQRFSAACKSSNLFALFARHGSGDAPTGT